jgi:MFS family permease
MQNVVLGALAYELSDGSPLFVGLIMFAQLGPLLILSMVGGMLADAVDRKKLLIALTVEQAFFSCMLAVVALGGDDASMWALFGVTLAIGIGNALYAPTFSAILPILVPREDMPGAISLNSAQMNGSRVIGPAIGSFLYAQYSASWVFLLNALSYVAIIVVLARVPLPKPAPSRTQGLHRLLEGVAYARRDRVVGRCLVIIFTFSLASLPFITQLPTIAGDNLDVVFALLRTAPPAYPTIFCLGAVYFAVITSLSTVLQRDLDDAVRGKVMALWSRSASPASRSAARWWPSAWPSTRSSSAIQRSTRAWPSPTDAGGQRATSAAARRSRPATRLPFTSTTSPSPSGPSRSTTASRSATSATP